MELENQSAINSRHKSSPIKPNQPSIAWIKFITPSSSFGPSLECPVFESTQISWISPLSASLIFLDLALVIGPTGTCNGSLNTCWFSSKELIVFLKRNIDMFAWSAYEAPGVDPNFICHYLNVNLSVIPKKQPSWRLSKDHSDAVKDEVIKLK